MALCLISGFLSASTTTSLRRAATHYTRQVSFPSCCNGCVTHQIPATLREWHLPIRRITHSLEVHKNHSESFVLPPIISVCPGLFPASTDHHSQEPPLLMISLNSSYIPHSYSPQSMLSTAQPSPLPPRSGHGGPCSLCIAYPLLQLRS